MDVEKTIQFILETQAKHEVTIQQILETQALHEERFRSLVDVSMSLARHGEETDRRIQETDRLIRELRDAQGSTDYKLNALIETVDKLVKRNGGRE